jgi:selenide,water dikinase
VKPIETALSIGPALDRLVRGKGDPPVQVAVVGAGLAGVEIALGIRERLRRAGQAEARITLVDRETRVAHDRAAACGREILAALSRGRIDLELGNAVTQAHPAGLRLAGGETLRADLVVWAAGAASPPLFRKSGLATDPDGFLLVDDALRSVSHPEVFGSGDAVTLRDHPGTPRTGVHAVRQGPILRDNLRRALAREAPERLRHYHAPRRTLALVNTGDGAAILSYGGIAVTGRWAMLLKDRIDWRFMRRFSAAGPGA